MRTKTLPKKPNIKPGVFFIPNGKAELSNSSSLLRCYVNFRGSVTYLITHLRIGFEADFVLFKHFLPMGFITSFARWAPTSYKWDYNPISPL